VVARQAAAAGWRVTAAGHRSGSPRLDVRDQEAVTALLRAVRPAAVVHTAYVQNGPDAWDVIAGGSGAVAAASVAVGARLVHLSTDVVFSGRAGRPYREDDPPDPLSDYGRAKAEAEGRVTAADPGAVIVRTSLIYGGPGGPAGAHERAAAEPDATFYVDELRCPVQVDDLAGALVELCTHPAAGPLHVAGPDAMSRATFAQLVRGAEVRRGPAPPGRPLDCRLDSSRAAGLLRTPLRGVRAVYAPARR
jgi:dTDP-4-dehydrorhamnose reductase